MRMAVVGTGYVGLVSGVCFANLGHAVLCVDKDREKIDMLNAGEIPIYEPGLQAIVQANREAERLAFTTDLADAVGRSDLVILAVGTPSLPNGEADLGYIAQAALEVGEAMNDYKIVIVKSTVPVGTNEKIRAILSRASAYPFDVVSVPEFLREGSAVQDTLQPDRIVIGADSHEAASIVTELHRPLTDQIFVTDIRSAEMIKYASNAFLATKISFINEIANICEKVGADVTQVAAGMGRDRRIGPSFLSAGIGYGGSCFPKDTQALIQIAGNVDYDFKLLKSVVDVNRDQRNNVIRKMESFIGDLSGRTIAVWGLAFKPNTDDVREAPSLDIIAELIQRGAIVRAYDPVATDNFRKAYDHPKIVWCADALTVVDGADALCLLTEWPEFAEADLERIGERMKQAVLFDGRNVFRKERLEEAHFRYYSIGRPHLNRFSAASLPRA
ncbi:UDP-glucose dehydrogenase family protein [Cohnella nanjingensis]|uniref:UDP-glucose 6-dehydrogenase n=1 Tax=Cohnella nanjingensis TaxID=1387779 RepID=A0A7X0VFE2_9BACL|nr:UDP-glucose/GDP-mannose dehydrogenase family protein [Cohnella nanjingensis]MBB6671726.1 UDP-glucose/GDP-mannose dehydrogenase family protein [Cohnella nanjingensis]